ncbi:MAG: bla regulator protein BlaR1 [Gammaproteobacteria bacterium]|jgi:bla regulator protein BlaR1
MMNYLLEVSLCWLGFYLLYALWLSKETFFQNNRWYLVATLLLGLCIPFAEMPIAVKMEEEQLTYLETVTVTVHHVEAEIATVVASPLSESIAVQELLLWIYGLGVLLMSVRFFYGLLQIYKHYRSSNSEKKGSYVLLQNKAIHLPFSFFHFLFISASAKYSQEELDSITRHELVHIDEHHSVDVILLEVLTILFWCSPLIYCYRRSIRNVHEYLADERVLQKTTKKQYGQLLLQQFQQGKSIAMANNFIHSQLKKRIQMMTKNQSTDTARWKYLLVIPMFICLFTVLSKTELTAQVSPERNEIPEANIERAESVMKEENGEIFSVVEEMPRFPGCEDVEDKEERLKCSKQKMLEFVYSNIKYPAAARKAGTEGMAVVRFVIKKNGKVQKAEMLRTIGGGCDEEVLCVVNKMPVWIPGKQRGVSVDVYYNLPVKFKLDGGERASIEKVKKEEDPKAPKAITEEELCSEEDIFTVVEDMPRFPGCEEVADMEERKECSRQKMLQFIYMNVKYPKEAQDAGAEGMVVVRFVINKKGEVMNPEILRSKGHGLDEAVLDVVEKMNEMEEQWIPGKQRGKQVNVKFNLPVKFKLDPAADCKDKTGKAARQTLAVESFEMSPNPAKNEVRLSFEIEDATDLEISLTDVNGKIILLPATDFTNGRNELNLDLSKVAPGILFVVLQNGDKVFTKQLVKQ